MTPLRHAEHNQAGKMDRQQLAPFQFECPLTVFKADSAPEGKKRRIAGIISTDSADRQNERILQDGLSFEDFIQHGWFNDNHSAATTDILGYPESVKQFDVGDSLPDGSTASAKGTWVEGYLLDTKKANDIWELAQSLAKTHRRLGYSVEGAIESRSGVDDSTIAKAKVRNVAITNCFPGDAQVDGLPLAISKRQYTGPMVHIRLANGDSLAGTPNHPMLTDAGWVALGDIKKGQHRVSSRCGDAAGKLAPEADVNDVPSSLEQIFDAALIDGEIHRILGTGDDFHGDGIIDGQVDIVTVVGKLRDDLSARFFQKFGKHNLPTADVFRKHLARSGPAHNLCLRAFGPSSDSASGVETALHFDRVPDVEQSAFFAASATDSRFDDEFKDCQATDVVLLGKGNGACSCGVSVKSLTDFVFRHFESAKMVTSQFDAARFQVDAHCACGAAKCFSDGVSALTKSIHFEHVEDVTIRDFLGHVYNLETSLGWYETQSMLNSNCPVNTDSRLEILARSLTSHNVTLQRSMTLADDSESAGPAKPNRPYTGRGVGQVLSRESIRGGEKKAKRSKELTRSEAVEYVKSHIPGCSEALARAIVHKTIHP